MARVRTYSGEHTILMACSVCGNSFEWPTEIRRTSDGLWRCTVYNCGADKVNQLDEDRAIAGARRKHDELKVPVAGIKPDWFT